MLAGVWGGDEDDEDDVNALTTTIVLSVTMVTIMMASPLALCSGRALTFVDRFRCNVARYSTLSDHWGVHASIFVR